MSGKGLVNEEGKVKKSLLDSVREALNDTQSDAKEPLKQTSENRKSEEKTEQDGSENLKIQLEEKSRRIEELTDTLRRLQAEFDNFRKRADKEKAELAKYSTSVAMERLLPVVDSFELAVKHVDDKEKFVQGVKMIYAQMLSSLESLGLKPIKTEGKQFDPYRHEVLLKEASDKPEGAILEELQKGYMLHDRVLRFSKVKVSGK